eukprot:CAMPEP_0185801160 /NCGR_PEP_ID=MMETSP1322-20130828/1287_1 /TAXON_ID=265543 /ORGANISM="Minutocellus polymorphus, Strain RCC2270" /LENGTH=249 /DNA_ID=CAMNT_0028496845 /DNA_START=52 /DNA_END=801 /DNA_ORIENTATION=+
MSAEEEAEMAAMLDLSKKKKKKKKTKDKEKSSGGKSKSSSSGGDGAGDEGGSGSAGASEEDLAAQRAIVAADEARQEVTADAHDRKADYTYSGLLDRVVGILHAHNPDLIEKKRRNMKPPQLTRVGTKKTLWVNFQEICTMMQRPPEHVFQFFMAELGTEGSIDGNQRLVIRGKYVPKYIESLLRKYIVEYVTCQMCRSPNTELVKDQASRLYFCNCSDCGSVRSVAPIRTGYHATSRADRRAARNAKA